MKQLSVRQIILSFIISFFMTFSIMNAGHITTTSVISVCIFFLCMLGLTHNPIIFRGGDWLHGSILSALFTIFYLCGDYNNLSSGLTNRFYILIYLVCSAIGFFFLFLFLIQRIYSLIPKISVFYAAASNKTATFPWKFFLITFGILFLCMVPFFLLNYPGVMTPDSLSQYRQIIGTDAYSNHHPWLHTMLFGIFYNIGEGISQSPYIGIACYTVFQMLLVSLCGAYSIACLLESGLKKWICVTLMVLFVICPFNLLYAVTIWKDILFSMAVLIVTVTLFRILLSLKNNCIWYSSKRDLILYCISGFFMCMFRHNGLYAFIFFSLILIVELFICYHRQLLSFALATLLVLALCMIVKGPLMNAFSVIPGEFAYKVCIPLQQIGRVITNKRDLTAEQTDLIEKINDIDYIPDHYQKGGADPMFAWVLYGNQDYLIDHKGEYLKLWIEIGLKYPGDYISAFLDQTRGYWFPQAPEQVVYFGITENEDSLIAKPILTGPVLIKINELITKLYTMIPIYGMFYSMGFFFFLLLLCCSIHLRYHTLADAFIYLPVIGLMLTVFIAVPLVADMRYGYPLVLCMPFLLCCCIWLNQESLKL